MAEESRQERFEQRYTSGMVPWDDNMPPPELIDLVEEMPAGRALDLGCGYGRSTIYMAQHGWQVDGVDFVPQAIKEAKDRAQRAGVTDRAHFHIGDVSRLAALEGPYDLALDIGCMHAMSDAELRSYRDRLHQLLPEGAAYLLFAHLRGDDDDDEDPQWIEEETLLALFAQDFTIIQAEYGETQVNDRPPWRSVWIKYRVGSGKQRV